MKYDHRKVRESNQLRAKTNLKKAIKEAVDSGLYYEDLMQVIADAINDAAEEKNAIVEEA